MSKGIIINNSEPLSAEEIKFSKLVAQGMSLTTAYRHAYPLKAKNSYDYLRKLAHLLYSRQDIKLEVATTKDTQAKLARMAEDRMQGILANDLSDTKGSKVAEVAMFVYDHANGKATQRIESRSTVVTLDIDLTGTTG